MARFFYHRRLPEALMKETPNILCFGTPASHTTELEPYSDYI